jgi:hypothetical protein
MKPLMRHIAALPPTTIHTYLEAIIIDSKDKRFIVC